MEKLKRHEGGWFWIMHERSECIIPNHPPEWGGGGGVLTYMFSIGMRRGKDPPFLTWPAPKTPIFLAVPAPKTPPPLSACQNTPPLVDHIVK